MFSRHHEPKFTFLIIRTEHMATMKESFLTDPFFCSQCGSILPLPGTGETVECRLCHYQQKAEVYEGLVEYTCKWFAGAARKQKGVIASKEGGGPLVDRKCPRCGHEQMTYATQQTRSADEGQTVFYTCSRCKFKETENS